MGSLCGNSGIFIYPVGPKDPVIRYLGLGYVGYYFRVFGFPNGVTRGVPSRVL